MNDHFMNEQFVCGFVGLGLIGGSIARAMRKFHPECRLLAFDINQDSLTAALSDGVIDESYGKIGSEFSRCDYIFLCAPVSENDKTLPLIKKYISPACILTDAGSVKTDIHRHIIQAGLEGQFIGGHPMAGSERTGYLNSKALLLENAYYILTPCHGISENTLTKFKELISSLGAIPLVLTSSQHDYVTAAVSHLPHVIAASLVNLIRDFDSEDGIMKMIAAGGFKDITRIASSSPVMWQQICMTNGENILTLLDAYMDALSKIRAHVAASDARQLYTFFDQARSYRDSFLDASSGPIKKTYAVNIEIADEPGALASIATILALHQISIKNIGITHNREQEDGVLKVEFYQESGIEKAIQVLSAKGYTVYRRN